MTCDPTIRFRLAEAQNWRCAYCAVQMDLESGSPRLASKDHVVPRFLGGRDVWDNLVAACISCNHVKDIYDAEPFARRRRLMAESGRWPGGTIPDRDTLSAFKFRLDEDIYNAMLSSWRARRGLMKPCRSERRHIGEAGQMAGVVYAY